MGCFITTTPAGEHNPPAGERNPPAGKRNAPKGECNPPAGEENTPAVNPVLPEILSRNYQKRSGNFSWRLIWVYIYIAISAGMKTKQLRPKKQHGKNASAQRKQLGGISFGAPVVQRVIHPDIDTALAAVLGQAGPDITQFDPSLQSLFNEAESMLPETDFIAAPGQGRSAEASKNPAPPPNYLLEYDPTWPDQNYLVASILHELIHAATDVNYRKGGLAQGPAGEIPEFVNLNFPGGLGGNQPAINAEMRTQRLVLEANLRDAVYVATHDTVMSHNLQQHVLNRLNNYALPQPLVHYDTVLTDILAYLELENEKNNETFRFIKRLIDESTNRRVVDPYFGIKRARRVDRKTYSITFWKW